MFHVYSTCLSESGPNFIPNHFKQVFGLVVFTRKSGGSLQFRLWVILYSRFYVTVAIVLALSYLYKDCIINYNNIKFRLLIKCNFSGHSLSLVDFFFLYRKWIPLCTSGAPAFINQTLILKWLHLWVVWCSCFDVRGLSCSGRSQTVTASVSKCKWDKWLTSICCWVVLLTVAGSGTFPLLWSYQVMRKIGFTTVFDTLLTAYHSSLE